MTPEQWRRVKEIFQQALDVDAAERTVFLHQACADDAELRQQIEALLVSDRNIGDFLAEPAIHLAGGCETEVERMHGPAPPDSPELQPLGPDDVLYAIGRGNMTPERFRQIRNLFEAVLERPPDARIVFLDQASQGD